MTRSMRLVWIVVVMAVAGATGIAEAQQPRPFSWNEVLEMAGSPMASARVIEVVSARCVESRLTPEIEARLRDLRPTEPALIAALRSACVRSDDPPAAAARTPATPATTPSAPTYSPGSAAIRSLLVPGLGQFYTRRPVVGAVLLGTAGTALAAGFLSRRVTETVECLSHHQEDVQAGCPSDRRGVQEESERTFLLPGLAVVAAVSLYGAFDAARAARTLNDRAPMASAPSSLPTGKELRARLLPAIGIGPDGAWAEFVRLEF